MERLNDAEMNATSSALWHTGYDYWKSAARCYDVNMPDLGDYYASQLQAIQSAYGKINPWLLDPTPVDETAT